MVEFQTPCEVEEVADPIDPNVTCSSYTQAGCTVGSRRNQCTFNSASDACERILPCDAETDQESCEDVLHSGECVFDTVTLSCVSKCSGVGDGDTLTSLPGVGGITTGTSAIIASRTLCTTLDGCFFDDGECRSKNAMPYPGLFVSASSLSGKKMMPRIDALQDCNQDLGCDCPRRIPAYTGSQGCLRIV